MNFSFPLLVEITGVIALVLTFTTFFFNDRKLILWIQASSLFFYSIHLSLFGLVATALFLFVQIFRNLFFAARFPRLIDTLGYIFLLLFFLGIYLYTDDGDSLSWLAMLGSIIGTTALWIKNTRWVRFVFFLSTLPWMYYVISLGALFPILLQITYMSSVIINIIRFDLLKK